MPQNDDFLSSIGAIPKSQLATTAVLDPVDPPAEEDDFLSSIGAVPKASAGPLRTPGFFEGLAPLANPSKMAASFMSGYESAEKRANLGKFALGLGSAEAVQRAADEAERWEKNALTDDDVARMGTAAKALHGAFTSILPGMAHALVSPEAMTTAAVGGGVGAAAGSAGMGVGAIPVGIAGAATGYGYGVTGDFYLQSVGDILETGMQNGIDFEDMRALAIIAGVPYAALERLKLGAVAKPLLKPVARQLAKKGVAGAAATVLGRAASNFGTEVSTETLQAGLSLSTGAFAALNNGDKDKFIEMAGKIGPGMMEEAKNAVGPMGVLALVGMSADGAAAAAELRLRGAEAAANRDFKAWLTDPEKKPLFTQRLKTMLNAEITQEEDGSGAKQFRVKLQGKGQGGADRTFLIKQQDNLKALDPKSKRRFIESLLSNNEVRSKPDHIKAFDALLRAGDDASLDQAVEYADTNGYIPNGMTHTFKDEATGVERPVDALITLGNEADRATLDHELFHAILPFFFTRKEYESVIRQFGGNITRPETIVPAEEAAAYAYQNVAGRRMAVETQLTAPERMLYRLATRIKSFTSGVMGKKADALYDRIYSGETVAAGTQTTAEEQQARIAPVGNDPAQTPVDTPEAGIASPAQPSAEDGGVPLPTEMDQEGRQFVESLYQNRPATNITWDSLVAQGELDPREAAERAARGEDPERYALDVAAFRDEDTGEAAQPGAEAVVEGPPAEVPGSVAEGAGAQEAPVSLPATPYSLEIKTDAPVSKRQMEGLLSVAGDEGLASLARHLGIPHVRIAMPASFGPFEQGRVRKQKTGGVEIQLNPNDQEIGDTLLHEIAHVAWTGMSEQVRNEATQYAAKADTEKSQQNPEETFAELIAKRDSGAIAIAMKSSPENVKYETPAKVVRDGAKTVDDVIRRSPNGDLWLREEDDINAMANADPDSLVRVQDANGWPHVIRLADFKKWKGNAVIDAHIRSAKLEAEMNWDGSPVKVELGGSFKYLPEFAEAVKEVTPELYAIRIGAPAQRKELPSPDDTTPGEGRRYMVVGRNGVMRMAQQDRERAELGFNVAKQMMERGEDPEKVRVASGWWKAKDGRWRYEISDKTSDVSGRVKKLGTARKPVAGNWTEVQNDFERDEGLLKDFLIHPDLFRSYPELRDVEVNVTKGPDAVKSGALYTPEEGSPVMQVSGRTDEEVRMVLLHEAQHYVQRQEMFARGGSIDEMRPEAASQSDAYRRYRQLHGEMEARDTVYRRDMTPAQRKKTPPMAKVNEMEPDAVPGAAEVRYSTARRDKEYMDAVERGDMETAQRLVDEAARRAGYDKRVFHGTTDRDRKILNDSFESGLGIFTTDNEDVAAIFTFEREYGEAVREVWNEEDGEYESVEPGEVIALYVKEGKNLNLEDTDIDPQSFVYDTALQSTTLSDAKRGGFDSVTVPDVEEGVGDWMEKGSTTVVFNSEQLKRSDPVTRDDAGNVIPLSKRFDTSSPDIRYSTASKSPFNNETMPDQRNAIGFPELVQMVREFLGRNPKIKQMKPSIAGAMRRDMINRRADILLNDTVAVGPVVFTTLAPDVSPDMLAAIRADQAERLGMDSALLVLRTRPLKKGVLVLGMVRDPEYKARVLAHEIGHLADWLFGDPAGTFEDKSNDRYDRGNILGRIAGLRKYMMDTLGADPSRQGDAITPEEYEEIRQLMSEPAPAGWEWVTELVPDGSGITAEDIVSLFTSTDARDRAPELYKAFTALSDADRKRIAKAAMKGVVDPALAGVGGRMREERVRREVPARPKSKAQIMADIKAEVERLVKLRGLYRRDSITSELKALSQWWSPFNESEDAAYTRYRHSPHELYADAVSVLLNQPEALAERAPEFWSAMQGWKENKPEFWKEYTEIQDAITGGRVEGDRIDRELAAMRAAEAKHTEIAKEKKDARRKWTWDEIVKSIAHGLWNRASYLPKAAQQHYKDIVYSSGRLRAYGRSVHLRVLDPLRDAGVTMPEFGVYLGRLRASTERKDFFNPFDQDVPALRARFGNKKFDAMQAAQRELVAVRREFVLPHVREAGLLPEHLMQYIEGNDAYAKFTPIDYLGDKIGIHQGMFKLFRQHGTLANTDNPLYATVEQDMLMMYCATLNKGKRDTIAVLEQVAPGSVRKPTTVLRGRKVVKVPPKENNLGRIVYVVDGVQQEVYVDERIAELFQREPIKASLPFRILQAVTIPQKGVLTTYNPLFGVWNFKRDFARFGRNAHLGVVQRMIHYGRTAQAAANYVFRDGLPEDAREMLVNGLLIAGRTWSAMERDSVEEHIERQVESWGDDPSRRTNFIMRAGKLVFNDWNQYLEVWTKFAAFDAMKKRGLTPGSVEMKEAIREQLGSPDFLAGGTATRVLNSVFIFSNANVQGITGDWGSFKKDPAWWLMHMAAYTILPAVMMSALEQGWFVDDDDDGFFAYVQDLYRRIPEYDKCRMLPIPFRRNGPRAGYLPIPVDQTGALAHQTVRSLLAGSRIDKVGTVRRMVVGTIPWSQSNLNGVLDVAMDVMAVASGINPPDFFRGVDKIDPTVFEAGGADVYKEIAKNTWNDTFGGVSVRFDRRWNIEDKNSKLQVPKMLVGPLGRFYRESDLGLQDETRLTETEIGQEGAAQRKVVKDWVYKRVNDGMKEPTGKAQWTRLYKDAVKNGDIPKDYPEQGFRALVRAATERAAGRAPTKVSPVEYADTVVGPGFKEPVNTAQWTRLYKQAQKAGGIAEGYSMADFKILIKGALRKRR